MFTKCTNLKPLVNTRSQKHLKASVRLLNNSFSYMENAEKRKQEISQLMASQDCFSFATYDCIGFDLDNTVARFKTRPIIELGYNALAQYLVRHLGYPDKLLTTEIDYNFVTKGLILDDENGNVLRLASNGTILKVSHGTRLLDDDEIRLYYPNRRWDATDLLTQDPLGNWHSEYSNKMCTLLDHFDSPASLIFARCVDYKDDEKWGKKFYKIWPDLLEAYSKLFDVRGFNDNVSYYYKHLVANPRKYYHKCSAELLQWLQGLRKMGKKLFLVTGSYYEFAKHTATNTLGPNWSDYFDIVVCDARKPGFFTQKRTFIEHDDSGKKTGFVCSEDLSLGKIYSGGNWADLCALLRSNSPTTHPKFLYCGDNVIQDLYAPDVYTECDTVCVCEELEAEGFCPRERVKLEDGMHPSSSFWGSFFRDDDNKMSMWFYLVLKHSKICIPSMEYVAKFTVDQQYKFIK